MPVGFLDPELMSLSNITSDKSYVVDYLGKAVNHYAKKEIIMFPHNPRGPLDFSGNYSKMEQGFVLRFSQVQGT